MPEKSDLKKGLSLPGILLGLGLAVGGLEWNNRRIWNKVPDLENKLPGKGNYFGSRAGLVYYKEAGPQGSQGANRTGRPPIVFVHGVGAGSSSYEWRNNFEAFSQENRCFAYDLLGFGNSDHPPIRYTAETYIAQLAEFLEEVVKEPAYVVAASISGAHAVQVAFRRPYLIKKLVLVIPDGIDATRGKKGPEVTGRFSYPLLKLPVLDKALINVIASRSSIKGFLESQIYYDKNKLTEEEVEQYYIAAHQPGSENAPASFFSGLLNAELFTTFGKIEQPAMVVWGRDTRISPLSKSDELINRNNQAQLVILDQARLGPYIEQYEQFNYVCLSYLNKLENLKSKNIRSA